MFTVPARDTIIVAGLVLIGAATAAAIADLGLFKPRPPTESARTVSVEKPPTPLGPELQDLANQVEALKSSVNALEAEVKEASLPDGCSIWRTEMAVARSIGLDQVGVLFTVVCPNRPATMIIAN